MKTATVKVVCAVGGLLATAVLVLAGEAGRGVPDRIARARERLGAALLTRADQVIARHVEAIGGREALRSVRTLAIRGRNVRVGQGDVPLYRCLMQPGFLRAMRTMQDTSYTLSDGVRTWWVTPAGRKELTDWWAVAMRHERIDGNFLDYEKQGIRYDYIGLEGFDTEPLVYYHLRRTFPDGLTEDLYFDLDSGLLHAVWPTSTPRKGSPLVYYDYRRVGGVLFPHVWMRVHDHAAPPHLFLVEEMQVNPDFNPDLFR